MNAILSDWTGPFALPPFAQIRDQDYAPAFDAALDQARAHNLAIANNPEAPTFANTIAAMEMAEVLLDRVSGLFWNIAMADSNPIRQELERELAPKMAAYSSEITNNKVLFARIDALWQGRDALGLDPEELRVLTLYHRKFVRAGACLEGAASQRMTEVKARLAVIGTLFAQNVLADERDWYIELTPAQQAELPDFAVDAAREAGAERGLGPIITTGWSLITPYLQFSPDRAGRAKAHAAWVGRGANGNDNDNRALAAETLALRAERAALLGYPNFAAYKLETEMAKTADAVRALLMRVWEPARAKALADGAVLEAMLLADGQQGPLQPWDWWYYSEKRRLLEHDLDEAELRPYLSLPAMLEAMFSCATRLFGLEFREIDGPFYHPDVRGWDVTRNGQHIAVFLGDYYGRAAKQSGAWSTNIRGQKKIGGEQRPIVVNVCSFAKGDPCLLSWLDARTVFHEFGHALHQMMSDVRFGLISGTNVASDFVELPSQLYEHWLEVHDVLDTHARHFKTGEPMPAVLRDRLLGAVTYDQGFNTVEYLASALVDLEFHDGPAPRDPIQKEAEVLAKIGMPKAIGMRHATPHFGHVFCGDEYSCGYYSYMWSEVMDADAFAAFKETGDPFDPELAAKLERHILSAGGSAEADELYIRFRGKMPGVEPLLKGRGLL